VIMGDKGQQLFVACEEGNLAAAEAILNGKDPVDIHWIEDKSAKTPLTNAITGGHSKIIEAIHHYSKENDPLKSFFQYRNGVDPLTLTGDR